MTKYVFGVCNEFTMEDVVFRNIKVIRGVMWFDYVDFFFIVDVPFVFVI
jgi:hypothetical protein